MIEDVEHVRAKGQAASFAEPARPEKAAHGEVNTVKPGAAKSIPPRIAQNARTRLSETFAYNRI